MNIDSLKAHMRSNGIEPPEHIDTTPRVNQRFSTNGKHSDDAGWLVIHDDQRGANYCDHRTNNSHTWFDNGAYANMSHEQQREAALRGVQLVAARKAEEKRKAEECKAKAASIVASAVKPTRQNQNRYLEQKNIRPDGFLVRKETLYAPIYDATMEVVTLQCIFFEKDADGNLVTDENGKPKSTKRFLSGRATKGLFGLFGNVVDEAEVVCVVEGFATGATVHEATGFPVLVALSSGNLYDAMSSFKVLHPKVQFIVCGELGPGQESAEKAAVAHGAKVCFPDVFHGSDFNDLVNEHSDHQEGLLAVDAAVSGATYVGKAMVAIDIQAQSISDLSIEGIDSEEFSAPVVKGTVEGILIESGTQHSVALAFAERYKSVTRYCYDTLKWYLWTRKFWAVDPNGLIQSYCRESSANLGGKGSQSLNFVKGVEGMAKMDRRLACNISMFDADNYLLNTPDGTIDLRTGEVRAHNPADFITNITTVHPEPTGGERFLKFLDEVTLGDKELAEFIQVALGATLSGAIENHWILFFIGDGRNGKNTLGDLVEDAMGSYARKIASSTLMKKRNEGHPTEIANLKGCRLAVASEVDQTAHWNEALLNELTGDANISARFMRGDYFEFQRTFKFLVYGNHRPRLASITNATRARIKMVPFKASFVGEKCNPNLPFELRKELAFVMQWLVDGHVKWFQAGKKLPYCAAVEEETEDYVSSQSTADNWMEESIEPGAEGSWVLASALYTDYSDWKKSRGEQPVSQSVWAEAMGKKYDKKRKTQGMGYIVSIKGTASAELKRKIVNGGDME